MAVAQKPLCNECETPEAQIVTLFTRNTYCGWTCLAKAQLNYVRFILRALALRGRTTRFATPTARKHSARRSTARPTSW